MKKIVCSILLATGLTMSLCHAASLTIYSKEISAKQNIPLEYTCSGQDISPSLSWKNTPAKTQSFAIILSDIDAPHGTFYHWVLYNIPSTLNHLSKDATNLPTETKIGKNSWGNHQYNGPCPPPGKVHHYFFTLYALDTTVNLPESIDAETLLNAIQDNILQKATLPVTFAR